MAKYSRNTVRMPRRYTNGDVATSIYDRKVVDGSIFTVWGEVTGVDLNDGRQLLVRVLATAGYVLGVPTVLQSNFTTLFDNDVFEGLPTGWAVGAQIAGDRFQLYAQGGVDENVIWQYSINSSQFRTGG